MVEFSGATRSHIKQSIYKDAVHFGFAPTVVYDLQISVLAVYATLMEALLINTNSIMPSNTATLASVQTSES
jgi:hypothetical protein